MKPIHLLNSTRGTTLFVNGQLATLWKDRLIGLMGRRNLEPDEGIVIQPCESIHTHWMRFAIDVVFIDVKGIVVKVCPNVRPWRVRFGGWNADTVIEGVPGMIERSGTQPGDRIKIVEREYRDTEGS